MTLKRIRKNVARQLFNADKEIILVGDSVPRDHFFGKGVRGLAIPIQKSKHGSLIGYEFDAIVNSFQARMPRRIGRRAAYYVRTKGNQ